MKIKVDKIIINGGIYEIPNKKEYKQGLRYLKIKEGDLKGDEIIFIRRGIIIDNKFIIND